MAQVLVVMTTTDSEHCAEGIADALLEERLAGCVQIVPLRSHYIWQGAVRKGQEWLLLIKTRSELYPRLEERLRALHHYEIPEIMALPVSQVSEAYAAWLLACLGDPSKQTEAD